MSRHPLETFLKLLIADLQRKHGRTGQGGPQSNALRGRSVAGGTAVESDLGYLYGTNTTAGNILSMRAEAADCSPLLKVMDRTINANRFTK